jgi:hypothetical protein
MAKRFSRLRKVASFEPELNQRPMDFCAGLGQMLPLQSTALPTELSKVFRDIKSHDKAHTTTQRHTTFALLRKSPIENCSRISKSPSVSLVFRALRLSTKVVTNMNFLFLSFLLLLLRFRPGKPTSLKKRQLSQSRSARFEGKLTLRTSIRLWHE